MFSSWLAHRCDTLGLDAEAVALMLGVRPGRVRSWLNESMGPTHDELARIAERIGDPHHPPGLLRALPLEQSDLLEPLVVVDGGAAGIGHLISTEGGQATVRYFDGPESPPRAVSVPLGDVRAARLSPQTRVFVRDDATGRWRPGRAKEYDREGGHYVVEFPDKAFAHVVERDLHVRSLEVPVDPLDLLAAKAHETGFFHERRMPLVHALVRHRAQTRGMAGLVSSRVELLPHQIGVVRRVATDPVLRYLLADEVGLGKTIEAGAIARQHLLDHPDGRVLVLAPPGLVGQWQGEWDHRFALYPYDPRIRIAAYAAAVEAGAPTLLIVDEAHHAAAWAWEDRPQDVAAWSAVAALAHAAEGVLLLSATPAASDTDAYLAMLHLLDPLAYPLASRDAFSERVRLQEEIGRKLLALDERAPAFLLEQPARDLGALLPDDEAVGQRVNALLSCLDGPPEAVADAVRRLRAWVSETYRLHRRMLRNRRQEAEATPHGRSEQRLREEWGLDARADAFLDALEQWRLDAVAADPSGGYSGVYRVLLETGGADLALVGAVAEARAQGAPPPADLTATDARTMNLPHFDGEGESLGAIADAVRHPAAEADLDRADLLAEALQRPLHAGERAVAFVSYPGVARRLAARLDRGSRGRPSHAPH